MTNSIRYASGFCFSCARAPSLLAAGLCFPLFLTSCKSIGGTYQDVEYDPAKLKTPSGHGLEKKEYPFDDDGRYRKEWVKSNATGKTRSASKLPETEFAGTDTPPSPPSSGATSSYDGPADGAGVAGNEAMEVVAAAPVAVPASPAPAPVNYHKVDSGDTLYSLSQRYGTGVDELKRVNGLTGDTIRIGQSLRLP